MGAICSLQDLQYISIHALPGSATLHRLKHNKDVSTFQFMHPLWDATYIIFHKYKFQFMNPVWDATILPYYCAGSQHCNFNSCAPRWAQL